MIRNDRVLIGMIAICAVALGALAANEPCVHAAGATRVDHSAFDTLLARYVDDAGGVRYAAWKRDDDDALDAYLAAMSAVDPAALADTSELLAYWINVYNALTIDAILYFYPVASIKDKVAMFGYNVWDDYTITIAGQKRSLNEIEHKILRKLGEPQIHFAIVCASTGCPRLQRDAYTGSSLDGQLDANTREFFANPEHIQFDTVANTVRLSPIFDWFDEDFGGSAAAKRSFVSRFLASDAQRLFLHSKDARVEYLDYDWRLNEAK